ncbi:hypothetical protein VPNG_00441 [Cytospora leucostoma]|uniref:Uncharacterized protein n=1 Tax=Cytospora leucostoma TaxID=1230097 RepID=A0A423XPK0_9PEZI|nr:hypothetical protein VPNG_00441 [Cytospora leucostoma]
MSNNNIDNIPGISTEVSTGQTFDLTAEEVSRVLRLLNLPELRLEGFSDDESSRILTAIQRQSGGNDDEFTHFLALPTLIYLAHEAAEAAEKDLLEKYRELEDAEVTINNLPRVLDYGDDTGEDEVEGEASCQCTQSGCSTDFLSRLDGLTLAVREAHIRTAEARAERGYLMPKYLWTWLGILTGSSVGEQGP